MKYRRVQLNEIQEDILVRLLQLPQNSLRVLVKELNLYGPEIHYFREFRDYLIAGHEKAEVHFGE